ncbi:MAG: hypothetical protein Q4D92_07080, partial [Slackia sp.]|nr:hypothetical protein [Slackia sp.]
FAKRGPDRRKFSFFNQFALANSARRHEKARSAFFSNARKPVLHAKTGFLPPGLIAKRNFLAKVRRECFFKGPPMSADACFQVTHLQQKVTNFKKPACCFTCSVRCSVCGKA